MLWFLSHLCTYTGAINIAGTHLSKDFQNQLWKAGLVKTETLRGEEVFSSGLTESHLSVPCFILEVSDLPDSMAQYTLVWNGSPAHTGIAGGGNANREFFNPDGDSAGNTAAEATRDLAFDESGHQRISVLSCGRSRLQGHLTVKRENTVLFDDDIDLSFP